MTFDLAPGARHALIGPNGAGKTTFVNLLSGALPRQRRAVTLFGEDITALPQHARARRGLARTFQVNQLFPELTPRGGRHAGGGGARRASAALVAPARAMPAPREEADRRCSTALRFPAATTARRPTAALPYGRQRLLEIALALALKPARAAAGRARRRRAARPRAAR